MTRRMKRVVVSSGLHEADIRPPALMSEFKRLSIQDAADFFADPASLVEVDCPACDSAEREAVFRKQEFLYNRCEECGSVYVSPRPAEATLAEYYANSRASRFRVEHFSRDTAKARRYHLLRSHANWMGQIVDETGNPDARAYADLSTHSPQIFDEIHALEFFSPLYSVSPLVPVTESEAPVTATTLDALSGIGAVSAFEKIEHQFSPFDFLREASGVLAGGGILFFTTRSVTGFDLQVLWDKTPYIFIPEHINLLSIEGMTRLVERCGLELVELSTPGQLDVELVLHAVRQDPSIKLSAFVDYLLHHRDPLAHADFQEFLQKHRLSSHVRVAARKPKE
ncbi:MAG: hypothetical protein HYV26_17885 [Candidatus Hydrogenedentes bacterium]|nr:hypothetical protein [Candidatus Hydrogenedentota bacterium]MBI3119161.1 hypothetical protein [Candidatus Hydrogenedentota bacterium]